MDNFYVYLKKQLLEYVESERKKGVPLETIENALLNAGHEKNIIDDVFSEIKKEEQGKDVSEKKEPVKKDLENNLKEGILSFFAKVSENKKEDLKKEVKETKEKSEEIVKEVIEEAEVIEEKTMLEGFVFFIYLVALGFLCVVVAGYSNSEIINVGIGFLPTIINVFVSFFALFLADNVPLYMMIPLVISSIFYAVGKFSGFSLFSGMEIEILAGINFVLSFIFNVLITYVRFLKPKHMKKRIIPKKKINEKSISDKNENKEIKKDMQTKDIQTSELKNISVNNSNSNAINNKSVIKKRKEIDDLKREFNIR